MIPTRNNSSHRLEGYKTQEVDKDMIETLLKHLENLRKHTEAKKTKLETQRTEVETQRTIFLCIMVS